MTCHEDRPSDATRVGTRGRHPMDPGDRLRVADRQGRPCGVAMSERTIRGAISWLLCGRSTYVVETPDNDRRIKMARVLHIRVEVERMDDRPDDNEELVALWDPDHYELCIVPTADTDDCEKYEIVSVELMEDNGPHISPSGKIR